MSQVLETKKKRRINKGKLLSTLLGTPAEPSPEMREIYEQHKKEMALKPRPDTEPSIHAIGQLADLLIEGRERQNILERKASSLRQMRLSRRDRRNPERNFELMPEKEILVEK